MSPSRRALEASASNDFDSTIEAGFGGSQLGKERHLRKRADKGVKQVGPLLPSGNLGKIVKAKSAIESEVGLGPVCDIPDRGNTSPSPLILKSLM
jgi:hypothetical protein